MNFYSILFIHIKVLISSKLHVLTALVLRSKSFSKRNLYKIIEVNKNERIYSNFIYKDITLNWFISKFSVKKINAKTNVVNWVRLLKITQLKRKIFFNESPKVKGKTKNKTFSKKTK